MRPKQSDVEMNRNIFTDPRDLHALHPDIAELLEGAAAGVRDAHTGNEAARAMSLMCAERCTLEANSKLVTVLGGSVDPVILLPLVRLTVEAMAHAPAPGSAAGQ